MSMPPYPAYKKSELTTLGDVPLHWNIKRFRRLADIQNGRDYKSVMADDGFPVIGSGGEFAKASEYLFKGESVLLGRKGTIDRPLYVNGPFWTVDTMFYTTIKPDVCAKFLYYCALTIPFGMYSTSTALPSLTQADLSNVVFAVPAYSEQQSIAAFLDREIAKIDALITEQEKLLVLLAEKRQATISRAVTRGLDPNAPFKSSGAGWLGEIPSHWTIKKVKRLVVSIEQGWSPQCENYPVEGNEEWGVLKVGCVNGGVFNAGENKKLPPELEPIPAYSLREGDLLVSRANTRDLVGSAAVVPCDFDRLLLCDKLYRLRLDTSLCAPSFLAAYLATREARGQIELEATGASSSMLNIGQSVILDLLVPLPDVREQAEITGFLAVETAKLTQLSHGAEQTIALLKERCTALITAAVTGKIDVRNAVPEELAA